MRACALKVSEALIGYPNKQPIARIGNMTFFMPCPIARKKMHVMARSEQFQGFLVIALHQLNDLAKRLQVHMLFSEPFNIPSKTR